MTAPTGLQFPRLVVCHGSPGCVWRRMSPEAALIWERVKSRAGAFPPEAFAFVQAGLRHTVESIKAAGHEPSGEDAGDGERHVSGQELCLGLRDFAVRQFGLLARTVLLSWNIRGTEDFGKIVFILVESRVLRKSDSDSMTDFQGVFDFDEAFELALRPAR